MSKAEKCLDELSVDVPKAKESFEKIKDRVKAIKK